MVLGITVVAVSSFNADRDQGTLSFDPVVSVKWGTCLVVLLVVVDSHIRSHRPKLAGGLKPGTISCKLKKSNSNRTKKTMTQTGIPPEGDIFRAGLSAKK